MTARYEELVAWQVAMELAEEIYRVTGLFPNDERFGMVAQMRRAAVSVPSNIAEGYGKSSVGEFRLALGHARGSLYELQTQLRLASRLEMVGAKEAGECADKAERAARLINGLIASKAAVSRTPNAERRTPDGERP